MSRFSACFFVQGEPVPKGSHKGLIHVRGPHGSRMVATMDHRIGSIVGSPWQARVLVIPDKSPERWEQAIKLVASAHLPSGLLAGAVRLVSRFILRRPKSVSEAVRPHCTVRPDTDKILRPVGDALTGLMFTDDAQVIRQEASKEYGERPGVEITVEEV